jgi:phosphatidylserine decarboxylase
MSIIDSVKTTVLVPVHREGYPFIGIAAALLLLLIWLNTWLAWPMLALFIWVVFFFRDPVRVTPVRDGLVIAPADGRISLVTNAVPPAELGLGATALPRVSIFMSVFDCHVNRAPITGTITAMAYRPGKFLNADLDKASEDNERNGLAIQSQWGAFGVVQIAGLVARRIVWWVEQGQQIGTGERFGMIRFGSRVDVYFPEGTKPLVAEGQKSVAGETVLADMASNEGSRVVRVG